MDSAGSSVTAQPALTYSSLEVSAFTGATLRQLQWWDEQHVIRAKKVGHSRQWSADEVLEAAIVTVLRGKGVSLHAIRRLLIHFRRVFMWDKVEGYIVTDGRVFHLEMDQRGVIQAARSLGRGFHVVALGDLARECHLIGARR